MESKETREMIRELSPQEMESASGGQGDTPCPPYDAYIYTPSHKTVDLHRGPGMGYSSFGRLSLATKVTVVEWTTRTWYRVSVNGKTGYVRSEYLIRDYIW